MSPRILLSSSFEMIATFAFEGYVAVANKFNEIRLQLLFLIFVPILDLLPKRAPIVALAALGCVF